jgi:hypothetical protein
MTASLPSPARPASSPRMLFHCQSITGTVRLRCVRTFYTSSSRADTARTRRRLLRPALAPAPLRERAGRLARDKVARLGMLWWLRPGQGGADCAEPPPQRPAR